MLKRFWDGFFAEPWRNCSAGTLALAFCGALVSGAGVLYLGLSRRWIATVPPEFMGTAAALQDIAVDNRLAAVALGMLTAAACVHPGVWLLHSSGARIGSAVNAGWHVLAWFGVAVLAGLCLPLDKFDFSWLGMAALFYWGALLLYRHEGRGDESGCGASDRILVASGLGMFIPAASAAVFKVAGFYLFPGEPSGLTAAAVVALLPSLAPGCAVAVMLAGVRLHTEQRVNRWLVKPVSLWLLWLFLAVLPDIYVLDGRALSAAPLTPVLLPLLALIAVGACRICRGDGRVSAWVAAALTTPMIFSVPTQSLMRNFYETGSRLTAYDAAAHGSLSTFKDVMLTYGMWDYLANWSNEFLGGGSVYINSFGYMFVMWLVMLAMVWLAAKLFPVWLVLILALLYGGGSQALAAAVFFGLLNPGLLDRPKRWCVCWVLTAAFLPFFRFPQGAVLTAATSLLFVFQAARVWRQDRRGAAELSMLLAATGFAMLVWPFADYFYGLCRIVLETAGVNSFWAAKQWSAADYSLLTGVLANALIAAPALALGLGGWMLGRGNSPRRGVYALATVSITLVFVFGMFSYSFTRIDQGFSRQAITLTALFALFLPVLWCGLGTPNARRVALGALAAMIVVNGYGFGFCLPAPGKLAERLGVAYTYQSGDFCDGAKLGLPSLGRGGYSPGEFAEFAMMKRSLDRVLAPGESFVCMSLYGLNPLMSRPLLLEHGNYFTITGDRTQLRMLENIRRHRLSATLWGWNYYSEGWPGIRTYYIYREALLNGLPLAVSPNYVLTMPESYFVRAGLTPPTLAESVACYERIFPDRDLGSLPAVWGRRSGGCEPVSGSLPLRYEAGNRRLSIALQPAVDGSEAGLLYIFNRGAPVKVELYWRNELGDNAAAPLSMQLQYGENIIPLDAWPRWLLCKENALIVLTSDQSLISLENAGLARRKPPER